MPALDRPHGLILVVVADHHATARAELATLFSATSDCVVVAMAEDATGAIECCETFQPDVAVVEVLMPGGGATVCEALVSAGSPTRVVVFSALADEESRRRMLEAGAVEYVLKGSASDELLAAVRRAADDPIVAETEGGNVIPISGGDVTTSCPADRPARSRIDPRLG